MPWRPLTEILLKSTVILIAGLAAPLVYWLVNQSESGQSVALYPLQLQWAPPVMQKWMIFSLEAAQIVFASLVVAIPTAVIVRMRPFVVATWLTLAVAALNFHSAMVLLFAMGAWDRIVGDLVSISIYFASTWVALHLVVRKMRERNASKM